MTTKRQVGGDHYLAMPEGYQPWQIIDAHKLGFYEGCALKYLLRKKGNVAMASELSDLPIHHIMENYILHQIKSCKRCYEAVKDYTQSVGWVQ